MKDESGKKAATARGHGATRAELDFLATQRVELNAMPSDVFVAFLERKLTEHGCRKVIPQDDATLESHARQVILGQLLNRELEKFRAQAEASAATVAIPPDLRQQVERLLRAEQNIPWDLAVDAIARRMIDGDGQ